MNSEEHRNLGEESPLTKQELETIRYWNSRSIAEKMAATAQLTSDCYRWAGVDVDKPMDKTIRRITWEEKNRAHEEAQLLFARYRETHQ